MRNRICLAAVLLTLAGAPAATAQSTSVLDRKVTVTFNQAPLESVLRTLRRQYGVRISYSNTALNLRQPVTLIAQNQPLRTVLSELLRDKNIGYELVGDQLVLHPAPAKAATKAPETATATATTTTVSRTTTVEHTPEPAAPTARTVSAPAAEAPRSAPKKQDDTPKSAPTKVAPKNSSGKPKPDTSERRSSGGVQSRATRTTSTKTSKTATKPTGGGNAPSQSSAAKPKVVENGAVTIPAQGPAAPAIDAGAMASAAAPAGAPAAGSNSPADSATRAAVTPAVKQDSVGKAVATPPAEATAEEPARVTYNRTAQISFLGPLGSNGLRSGQTVNKVSLNVLGGYSAGVDGVEAAGLFNVDRDTVTGLQVAGLANVVGKRLDGYQGAGLGNVLGGGGTGWQSGGLFNVATRPMAGAQTAGLFNYSGPAKEGAATDDFLVQAGGLFNVSLGEVKGVQAAGLFNVANHVHGLQLAGLINIADSVRGVSLAPLNFVRHGYHRLELTHSETWLAVGSLKLGGSPYFYTFFSGAIDAATSSHGRRWGVGYGLGSELLSQHRFSLTIDALALHVNEEKQGWTNALNLHNQLRLLAGFTPFKKTSRVRIVAGPVFNVLVTQRYDTERQAIGSRLSEGHPLWINGGNSSTRVVGWLGFTSGIRF